MRQGRTCLLACIAALAASGGIALAAAGEQGRASEFIFLMQLMLLMLVGRLLGEAMNRVGQPSVMGMLLGGIVLGPSVSGTLWPDLQHAVFPAAPEQKAMLDGIAQFGILLLLLLTGMETDLKLVRRVGKAALSISLTGVAIPFICGFALGELMPETLLPRPEQRLVTSLFLGTALSISSIKIVAAVVREMNFTRRDLGQIIVASAICEDSMGWIIIAVVFGLAEAGAIDAFTVAKSVLGTAVFLAASFTVGRRLVFLVIRWVNDHFESDFSVITAILVIMGAMALTTHFIGVHTVLGAFVAGVLIGDSPILGKHIDEQLRGLILAFFMPVFFGIAGLSADLTILKDASLALMVLGLIVIASVGKFAGAFVGGKLGGLTKRESFALACGMNARGSTEVIVATIGLSMGALSQNLFTIIVAMALATTMAMPPMLRRALARVPMSEEERERLAREEFEAKGFAANLERLLLTVDESANGRLASRLAGLLAGARGIPITVLAMSSAGSEAPADDIEPRDFDGGGKIEESLKAAAAAIRRTERGERQSAASLDVTVRDPGGPSADAVAKEAGKGYDLMIVGIEKTRARDGRFHVELARIASAFPGPITIVTANGMHRKQPERGSLRILVPLNGTAVSRRAAELAIDLAAAASDPVTALYVANTAGGSRARRRFRAREEEQAIVEHIVEVANRYDVRARTAIRSDAAPEDAILVEARTHDLIVMGVDRRPGDKLFFGDTAAAVFEKSPASILFVAS
jgi:Kef-type K+ transport system membrane component KefB/nucleotide-binding universal stress UspA family protein